MKNEVVTKNKNPFNITDRGSEQRTPLQPGTRNGLFVQKKRTG